MIKISKTRKKSIYLNKDEETTLLKMMEVNGYKSANKFLRDLVFEDANPISNRLDNVENELIELKNYIKEFKDVFAKSDYVQTHMWIRSIAGIITERPRDEDYVIAEKHLEYYANKAEEELKKSKL